MSLWTWVRFPPGPLFLQGLDLLQQLLRDGSAFLLQLGDETGERAEFSLRMRIMFFYEFAVLGIVRHFFPQFLREGAEGEKNFPRRNHEPVEHGGRDDDSFFAPIR